MNLTDKRERREMGIANKIAPKGIIDLGRPDRSETVRGFQPPWRTVYVYRCKDCGNEIRLYANRFMGNVPQTEVGAIQCRTCIPAV